MTVSLISPPYWCGDTEPCSWMGPAESICSRPFTFWQAVSEPSEGCLLELSWSVHFQEPLGQQSHKLCLMLEVTVLIIESSPFGICQVNLLWIDGSLWFAYFKEEKQLTKTCIGKHFLCFKVTVRLICIFSLSFFQFNNKAYSHDQLLAFLILYYGVGQYFTQSTQTLHEDFILIFRFCVYIHVCVWGLCMWVQSPRKTEEDVRSPGAEVTGGCELPRDSNSGPLYEQYALLTTVWSV